MKTPLKVLHVIQKMYSGGVEQRRLLLAQLLDKAEFKQKIICSEADPEFRKKFEQAGCEVFEVGYLKHPLDWKVHHRSLKIIRKFKPQIIHGGVFEGNSIAAIDGFLAGVPCRLIEETSFPTERKKRAHYLMKFLSLLSHQLICISPEVAHFMQTHANIPESKIKIINNAVRMPTKLDIQEKKTLRVKYQIHPDDIVLGSVGRMQNHIKGFDKLLKLFAQLHQQDSQYKLIIVGDGPMLDEYKASAQQLGIADAVIFTGYQSDVNALYEIMHAYISLPRNEGFGLSIVEAMSHAIPVLASEVGGIKNIIKSGENGYLLKDESFEEVSTLLTSVLTNEALKNQLTQNAMTSFQTQYSPEVYIQNIRELYLSCATTNS